MSFPIFQVDAFTHTTFQGNPAAVCLLDHWFEDGILQAIAMENNLSETAFVVQKAPDWELRWFTPLTEVNLCGHATLATAHVLFSQGMNAADTLQFHTRSGTLSVAKQNDQLMMDFPALPPQEIPVNPKLLKALDLTDCLTTLKQDDLLVVLEHEDQVSAVKPNFVLLKELPYRGVIVTAPGTQVDFVSRFFGPRVGVDEDPVTGSAHCILTPYWSARLGKSSLQARQISSRGGDLTCQLHAGRVHLTGQAVTVLKGEFLLDV